MEQLKRTLILAALLMVGSIACNRDNDSTRLLQNRIDSLESKVTDMYIPGFGEFMSNIQAHHAKLWFAGQNQNWALAEFEVNEIKETVEDIEKYETEREESKLIVMIKPVLDSIAVAVNQKDTKLFKRDYTLLTNTCNNCHHAAKFEFNVVKIPDKQMFSNQDFRSNK